MSEVKRYYVNLDHGTRYSPVDGCDQAMNKAEDFDRVTAERDRLDTRLSCMSGHVLAYKLSRQRLLGRARARELLISELQQRLTAANERADVLVSAVRANHDWHKLHDDYDGYEESDLHQVNVAALKPAEAGGKPCACPGCDSPRRANSPFCVAHRSAKSRTRGQDPLTADGLEWLMQNDGLQQ